MASVGDRQRAADAWWMNLERSHRPLSAGEVAKKLVKDSEVLRVKAAAWVARNLPDCVDPVLGVCDFATGSVIAVRREYPDVVSTSELVVLVRQWRAGWMQRVGAVDDEGQVAA